MMISLGEISIIIIIQSFILLIAAVVILLFVVRAKNKTIAAMMESAEQAQDNDDTSPMAAVEYYLTAEIKLLETRFELLFKKEDLMGESFGEHDWIALRKGFLEIEKDLLVNSGRVNTLWIDTGEQIKQLLDDCHLAKRSQVKSTSEQDDVASREIS